MGCVGGGILIPNVTRKVVSLWAAHFACERKLEPPRGEHVHTESVPPDGHQRHRVGNLLSHRLRWCCELASADLLRLCGIHDKHKARDRSLRMICHSWVSPKQLHPHVQIYTAKSKALTRMRITWHEVPEVRQTCSKSWCVTGALLANENEQTLFPDKTYRPPSQLR